VRCAVLQLSRYLSSLRIQTRIDGSHEPTCSLAYARRDFQRKMHIQPFEVQPGHHVLVKVFNYLDVIGDKLELSKQNGWRRENCHTCCGSPVAV